MANLIDILFAIRSDPNQLLISFLLPFMLIFVILWGLLNIMKVFGNDPTSRKINLVIALVLAILSGFTGIWSTISAWASNLGQFSVVLFIIVFVIGALLWAIGRGRNIYHGGGVGGIGFGGSLKDIDKRLSKLYKKREEEDYKGNGGMVRSIDEEISKLEKLKESIYNSMVNKKYSGR